MLQRSPTRHGKTRDSISILLLISTFSKRLISFGILQRTRIGRSENLPLPIEAIFLRALLSTSFQY